MAAQIRPAILNKITHTLNSTLAHVGSHDFTIESKNGQFTVTYNYKSGVFFRCYFDDKLAEYTEKVEYKSGSAAMIVSGAMEIKTKEVTKQNFNIHGTMSPGGLAQEEQFEFYGVAELQKKLGNWINYIWEDLSAEPIIRTVNNYQQQLQEFLEKYNLEEIPNGENFFSKEEAEQINQKLNALEESLKTKLDEVTQDKKQLAKELEELKKEFEGFRKTVPNLDKKNWFKAFLTKLFVWGSKKENQQLLQAAAACGKTLLENKTD